MALCLFGNSGFRDLVQNWKERHRLRTALAVLRNDHESLAHELTRLQQDPSYTEYLIRRDLGYVKKGEVEYRFPKPEKKR